VSDRQWAGQFAQTALVDRLGHQSQAGPSGDCAAVRGTDTCRFLSAVLKGVQAQVGKLGRVGMIGDSEQSAKVVDFRCHGLGVLAGWPGENRSIPDPARVRDRAAGRLAASARKNSA